MSVRYAIRASTLFLICSLPARSIAQSTTSLIPDATVLPKRAIGFRLLTSWTRYDQLTGVGPNRNIAASLNADSLGPALLPQLGGAETAIRTLSGLPNFRITAGNIVAIANSRIVTAPLIAQYGLTSRLTLGVVIPLVQTRTTLFAQLNPRLGLANVGPNPALTSADRLAQTGALVSSFRSAATNLQQRLTQCQTTPSGTGCSTLLSQQAAAQTLIQSTGPFASALETLYGTGDAHPGQAFVPISKSASQLAIDGQIEAMRGKYQELLGSNAISGAVTPAGGPAARAEFQSLLESAGRDTLQSPDHSLIGDISIGATYQLANTFGDTSAASAGAMRYRLAMNGTVRIGTGQAANRNVFLDIGTGYGQPGVELGAAADLQFGRRYSATASASYTMQLSTIDVARVPNAGNALLPFDVAPLNAGGTYSAGNVVALSLVPRVRLSGYLAVTGQYSLLHTGADRYTLGSVSEGTAVNAASVAGLGVAAATAHQVGFGLTYSTIVGRDRGPGRIPFEASFSHLETLSGSGGPLAKTFRDQIELRVFFLR